MSNELKEVIEGNKLIASFCGYKFQGDGKNTPYTIANPNEEDFFYGAWILEDFNEIVIERFYYHSSWNLLMPVVEKIESMGVPVVINFKTCSIEKGECTFVDASTTKIEAVYNAVLDFIKWYNTQSK